MFRIRTRLAALAAGTLVAAGLSVAIHITATIAVFFRAS